MKRLMTAGSLLGFAVIASSLLLAQDDLLTRPIDPFEGDRSFEEMRGSPDTPLERASRRRAATLRELEELKRSRKKYKDDAQFESATKAAVSRLFDVDMEYRRQQLALLAKRVERNEVQLDQRQRARDELIDLQLRSFKMDAQGFGLSKDRTHSANSRADELSSSGPISAAAPAGYGPVHVAADPRNEALSLIRRSLKALAESKDTDAESKTIEDLNSALGDYFDVDMKLRRKELDSVKQELSELETKLKKRADAKSQIIDLQLKIIVKEANGLGFFSGVHSQDDDLRWPGTDETTPGPVGSPSQPQY